MIVPKRFYLNKNQTKRYTYYRFKSLNFYPCNLPLNKITWLTYSSFFPMSLLSLVTSSFLYKNTKCKKTFSPSLLKLRYNTKVFLSPWIKDTDDRNKVESDLKRVYFLYKGLLATTMNLPAEILIHEVLLQIKLLNKLTFLIFIF